MALSGNASTNILRLLASDNERNSALALQLLDSQLARQDFLASLGAHLLTAEGPVRAYLQNCLQMLAKAIGINNRHKARPLQLLLNFGKGEDPEAETEEAIQALHQLFDIDPLMLALYTYHYKGLCGALILKNGSRSDIRRLMESRIYQSNRGKTMGLQNLNMEQLPEDLAAFEDIEALDLSGNQLRRLPASLLSYSRLNYLNAQFNAINHLPRFLLASHHLECLDLRHNKLRMPWLEYLQHPAKKRFLVSLHNESGFTLNELHEEDTGLILANLSYASDEGLVLGLASQQIREVPDAVFRLRNLRILDLRDNPLPSLPAWLLRMPQLIAIYCDPGVEYNPAFKQAQLEVLRESTANLPSPRPQQPGRAVSQDCPITLPLELKLPDVLPEG